MDPTCTQDDCAKQSKARGLCARHYGRWRRTSAATQCSEDNCDRSVLARNMCSKHYQRTLNPPRRWRLTAATQSIPIEFGSPVLPERIWSHLVQTRSGCWQWTGVLTKEGYARLRCIDQDGASRKRLLHSIAYEAFLGTMPAGLISDHICHTNDPNCNLGAKCPHRACCRPDHLEPVTDAENKRRRHPFRTTLCPAGHPYLGDNLIIDTRGYELCRTCRREQAVRRRERSS